MYVYRDGIDSNHPSAVAGSLVPLVPFNKLQAGRVVLEEVVGQQREGMLRVLAMWFFSHWCFRWVVWGEETQAKLADLPGGLVLGEATLQKHGGLAVVWWFIPVNSPFTGLEAGLLSMSFSKDCK